MGMRVLMGAAVGMGLLFTMAPVWAADGNTAEAAQAGLSDTTREHILQTIEATRQTDPELAAEMEKQLKLLESGQLDVHDLDATTHEGLALGAPPAPGTTTAGAGASTGGRLADTLPNGGSVGPPVDVGGPVGGGLIGPPVDGGTSHGQDPRFEQVQSDPRMQQVREQFESGQLSEDQAREKVFEVLRDHGIEPNNGREWEHGNERGEGFEHALERMDPAAREQLERAYGGHETEAPEKYREIFEREYRSAEPTGEHESLERAFEGPQIEHASEAATREYEAPTHDYQAPERTYEAPEREYQAPQPESQPHEYQGSPQP